MAQGRENLRVSARGSQGRATPPATTVPVAMLQCCVKPWQRSVPTPVAGPALAVLTILPPMALMCCCSVSQCLSCGSAAYCNKAPRTELRMSDRPSPESPRSCPPLCSALRSACPAPASALALAIPPPWQAHDTIGKCCVQAKPWECALRHKQGHGGGGKQGS